MEEDESEMNNVDMDSGIEEGDEERDFDDIAVD